jgi:hypothetical protein
MMNAILLISWIALVAVSLQGAKYALKKFDLL